MRTAPKRTAGPTAARGDPMKISRGALRAELALVVALVPKMRRGAPKRNLVVALVYLLGLWVVGARLLLVL